MDIEQLKLIIEAFGAATDQGKSAFIWWLVLDKGLHFLGLLAIIGMVMYIVRAIASRVESYNRFEEALVTVGQTLGLSTYSPVSTSETRDILREIRRLKGVN